MVSDILLNLGHKYQLNREAKLLVAIEEHFVWLSSVVSQLNANHVILRGIADLLESTEYGMFVCVCVDCETIHKKYGIGLAFA